MNENTVSRFNTYNLVLDDPEAVSTPTAVTVQHKIFAPYPGQQTKYAECSAYECLFGGQAGPGKSFMLALDALGLQFKNEEFGLEAYKHPQYRAVLFRRTNPRLLNLIDICKEVYTPLKGEFVLARKGEPGASFTFPSGSKIFLCHLEHDDDVENHQGLPYQFVGFDELPQFLFKQYVYLFSRMRGTVINNGVSLDKRIRSTANPVGEGLVWVRKRFIEGLEPEKTYFFVADNSSKDVGDNPKGIEAKPGSSEFIDSKSRTFIPGYLTENISLMESDPGYASSIMQLGAKMDAALRKGDWYAFGGDFFDMFNRQESAEDPFDIPENWTLHGAIDPGWSSPCAFTLATRSPDRIVHLLFTYYVSKKDPETHARSIYSLIKSFPYTKGRMPSKIVAGLDAFARKERYSSAATQGGEVLTEMTFAKIFNEQGMYLSQAATDRIIGWWTVKQYMTNSLLKCFKGYNEHGINEISSLQTDPDNVEDIQGGGDDPNVPDHFADELRYLLMSFPYPFAGAAQKYIPEKRGDYPEKRSNSRKKTTVMSA